MPRRPIPRGVYGDRRPDRGDDPCQFAGGEPQQPAAELLHAAPPSGLGLPESAPVLPQPPRAGAERSSRTRGEDPRRTPDRPGASPLAGDAGLHSLQTRLSDAVRKTPQGPRSSRDEEDPY